MKRALTALALCLALSGCLPTSSENRQTDEQGRVSGTFTGTGQGKQGEIKVDVMIDQNQIQHIEILSHNEIPGFDTAMVQMSDEILSKNSLQVEAVSGATYTSKGFLEAVQDALDQAGIREDQLGWSDALQKEQMEGHYGLQNVLRRCRIEYGEKACLSIDSTLGVGTCVTLTLPVGGKEESV